MTFDEAFERLGRSQFRSRFRLTAEDWAYIERVGMETVERHAADFVREKLSAAVPANDGRQTPMRGHPAFKAMHATACCCRGCMEKWWSVKRGVPLSDAQQAKAVNLILEWIRRQAKTRAIVAEGGR
jgi:inosine-uridine nucleoside N-ribohydrolase